MTVQAHQTGRRTGLTALAAGAALVAAVTYSSFLLAAVLQLPAETTRGFISRAEVPGQPWAWLFRTCDAISGFALLVTALCAATALAGRRRGLLACSMLGLAGLSSITDATTTMHCGAVPAGRCAASMTAPVKLLNALASAHTVSGLSGLVGVVAGLILLGELLSGEAPWRGGFLIVTGVLVGVTALLEVVLMLRGTDVGACERARTLLTSAALVGLAGWWWARPCAASARRHPR